jgi:hypothetical protein
MNRVSENGPGSCELRTAGGNARVEGALMQPTGWIGCPIKNEITSEGEDLEHNKRVRFSFGYVFTMGLNYAFESLHPVAKHVVQFRG